MACLAKLYHVLLPKSIQAKGLALNGGLVNSALQMLFSIRDRLHHTLWLGIDTQIARGKISLSYTVFC